ncbi:related to killer toxin insensitive protein 3 [Cephalotrichum gorgonifer]|uniref:Elongator complex protein 1 n=1 Tax=Cephalotrichum gorgonifer TaxID=2041049 RepID=A0AAE8N0Z6_9PEZI|nr:related to killer toxin insensitive protein 3 [Cephalotrichum gorgonifer]
MRNLRAIRRGVWEHPGPIRAACWDPARDEVICAVGPTEESSSIELFRLGDKGSEVTHSSVASWDVQIPSPDAPADRVLSIHHSSDTLTTTLVFASGDITIVRESESLHPEDSAHIEIVGSVDGGIAAARWSPDEELLAVVSNDGEVIFMGRDFEPIAQTIMTTEDLGASKHVSVGWGKKETQFQGKGARALRDPTIPERVDEGVLSPNDDGSTTITWRGDGAYVAVNSIHDGTRRVIRVYSREGALDSASEPVDGLEATMSWRPSGNLIAAIQRRSDRVDVVFFERNGLRHGEFTLRSSSERIKLEWNHDSTVLAVIFSDRVQLWTMGNYHWYLKQEIPLKDEVSAFAWHPERALRLSVATNDTLAFSEYIFTATQGSLSPPHDFGAAAVIDGNIINITPFRTANVPPPLSLFELTTEGNAIDVAYGPDDSTIAVLHSSGVDIFSWETKNGRRVVPTLAAKAPVPVGSAKELPLQIFCSGPDEFCVVSHADETLIRPCVLEASEKTVRFREPIALSPGSSIMACTTASFVDDTGAKGYVQSRGGNIQEVADGILRSLHARLPALLPWNRLVAVDGELVAIGLNKNGHLYAGSRVLAKNCTSFLVTPSHIVFTTNNHFVKFVHLDEVEAMEVPADDPEVDERCRSIERGARLVTAIPTNMSLVLQMPRGNVETIFPRAMVVAGIRQLIDEKNYKRAFAYCRTQRVDMNILYDHRPAQFLAHVGLFLDQLEDVSYIDLFLSSLKEEDVSQTMYKDTKRQKVTGISSLANGEETDASVVDKTTSKVNRICDAVLKALQSRKATNLQNIITAHVCKVPPALEDGLNLVAGLMREDETLAEKAVEHICFLVDVNRLYDHALGLYDLELTLLVAQQAQKDPKEYVPFVQGLHEMSELRRRFTIDDHLGRREKALVHLKELDAFEELQNYMVKYALYQKALAEYRYDGERHAVLMDLYAQYLESKSEFREAGLAYESLKNYQKATACYCSAGATCWQECLFASQQQTPPLSGDALGDLATDLAEALWEAKDYASAATIYDEYLSALEMAVRCLCKGYHFADAMRLVTRRGRPDLLATAVDSGITDALSSTTEFLADCKGQLGAQVPRILELRRRAEEDPLSFYEGERPGGADAPDDVSIAASSRLGTSASLFTRYTGKGGSVGTLGTGVSRATSKNRKREEKKRARGRKGTIYEEEYLVNSVRRLVERVEGSKGEAERLVFALVRRGMQERARAVEGLLAEVVEACRAAIVLVFPVEKKEEGGAGEGEGEEEFRPTGADAVVHELMQNKGLKQEPPVITDMKKLALLG